MYVANLKCSLADDPKQFLKCLKYRKSSGPVIGNGFVWNDKQFTGSLSIADAFVKYLGSVYEKPDQLKWEVFFSRYDRCATFNYFAYNY